MVFRLTILATVLLTVFFLGAQKTVAQDKGFSVVVGYADGTTEILHLNSHKAYAQVIMRYATRPSVLYVEPLAYYKQTVTPNDTLFASQTALSALDAETAWDTTTGSTALTVAILDSGVDISHPDLSANVWQNLDEIAGNNTDDDGNGYIDDRYGWDFVENSTDVTPRTGSTSASHHGTVIAGIVGAKGNNGLGVTGVAWNVKLMSVRVLGQTGGGNSVDVAKGVKYAADNGADVINLSITGSQSSTTLVQAIQYARSRGVVVIASAGNDSLNLNVDPRYPVCHTGVIGVASVTDAGVKSSFSNYGSNCVDLSAPGQGITSTVSTEAGTVYSDDYVSGWSGTSFASPYVAGTAVLAKAHQPSITREQLEALLVNSVTSIDSKNPSYATGSLGAGMISAAVAVSSQTPPNLPGASIVTFPYYGGGPHLRWFDSEGDVYRNDFIEDADYRGTGDITSCDVNGDGVNEFIYGTGRDKTSRVKIYSSSMNLLREYRAFSSPQNGIRIACGDTNGDGKDDVVAIREEGSQSEIRIFYEDGTIRKRFLTYPASFLGGMDIAVADTDKDGKAEIITGTGPGGLPRVQLLNEDGQKIRDFFTYGLGYRGGVNVSAGDVDGDGTVEIITAPRFHGGPHVRIFDNKGNFERDFFAYGEGFHGGVQLAVGDVDGDGIADIVTGAGRGGGPHVRVFQGYGNMKEITAFFAYSPTFGGGVTVLTYKEAD